MNDNLNMNESVEVKDRFNIDPSTNKRSKWKFIIGGIIFVVVLAVIVFIGYNRLNSDPVSIYKNTINDVYKLMSNELNNENSLNIDILNEPVNIRMNAKLDTNISELKAFNNLNYDLALGLDYKNKKGAVNLGISEDNKAIIKLLLSIANKKVNLKSDELLSKTISLGEYDLFKDINLEDINDINLEEMDIILKEMKNILINSLDKNKFDVENTKIKIGNKEENLKKITYNFDAENAERTVKYVIEEMLKNDNLLNSLSKMTNTDKDTIKEFLNDSLDEIDTSEFEGVEFILYVDVLNNVRAASITSLDKEFLHYEKVDDLFKITITGDASLDSSYNEEMTINIEEQKDGGLITIYVAKEKILEAKITENDKDYKIDLKVTTDEVSFDGSLKIDNQKYTKSKYSGNFDLSLNVTVDKKDYDFNLKGLLSIDNSDVNVVSDKNSIYYEDLSEKDVEELYDNLTNILKKFNLSDLLEM